MDAECTRHRDRFSEYLDGELSKAEREAVEAHLSQCAECRRELEAWRRTVSAVGELPARSAPAGFAERVMRQIAAAGRAPERSVVSILWARVLPVAAMLLLVVGLTFTVQRHVIFEKGAPEARPAVAHGPSPKRDLTAAPVRLHAGERLPTQGTSNLFADRAAGHERMLTEPRTGVGAPAGPPSKESSAFVVAPPASPAQRVVALAPPAGGAPALSEGAVRRGEVTAEAQEAVPREEPASAAAGFVAGGKVLEDRKAEAAPALSWRAPTEEEAAVRAPEGTSLGALVRGADATGRTDEFGYGGGRAADKEVIFGQIAAAGSAAKQAPAQQLLTMTGKDQAGLARQVVAVANSNGLPATLALSDEKGSGAVEVRLSVPVERYDAVLKGLAELTPRAAQNLANTAAADTYFFQQALIDYDRYQNAAAVRKTREAAEKRAEPGSIVTARESATPARPNAARPLPESMARSAAKAPSDQVARQAAQPAAPVELVVRVVQPGSAQGR